MSRGVVVLVAVCIALSVALALAGGDKQYIGVAKCKMCHKKAKVGNQYGKWSKGPHAKTYTELAEPKSKEIAKKAGVKGDPQKAPKCLKCHVSAYGLAKERYGKKYTQEEGVSCEACHGAASGYKTSHIKKKAAAKKAGLIVSPDEASCKKCHNPESPTYKKFNFKEKKKKIAHPMPKK